MSFKIAWVHKGIEYPLIEVNRDMFVPEDATSDFPTMFCVIDGKIEVWPIIFDSGSSNEQSPN